MIEKGHAIGGDQRLSAVGTARGRNASLSTHDVRWVDSKIDEKSVQFGPPGG
jgi:hypothetical protein